MVYYQYYLKNVSPSKKPRDKDFSYYWTSSIIQIDTILANRWKVCKITSIYNPKKENSI